MSWFFIVAILASLIIACYLGFRTINLFNLNQQGYFNTAAKKLFWLILIIGSLSFVGGRVFYTFSDYWFPLIGNIVFSLILCFFYGIVIIDLFRLLRKYVFKKADNKGYVIQTVYLIISTTLFIIGLYMASCPRIAYYQVNIDKPASVKQLKIVQLTDIHISETTSKHFIQTMVNEVNQLKPDYIVITGDTLDMRLKPYVDQNFAEIFAQLNAQFGTFIIFGNHEHYGIAREQNNSLEAVIAAFEAGNMQVLLDNTFYDPQTGITLIGRDDFVVYSLNKTRQTLSELVAQVDNSKPVILLDHQPKDLDEPEALGIDMMFSGHTHAGQVFPMNLLVNAMYKNPWGLYQSSPNSHFVSIVSSGYGLWGPPIRLMTRAEIVVTEINFNAD